MLILHVLINTVDLNLSEYVCNVTDCLNSASREEAIRSAPWDLMI